MLSSLYHSLFSEPIYNTLIFLINHLHPYIGVGGVVIILTLLVKIIIFPLSKKQLESQAKMKKVEPMMADIRKKYKNNPQEQSAKIMGLYKEQGINPLSGIWPIIIQIMVISALYRIFLLGGLPEIHMDWLYGFIQAPLFKPEMIFFGIDITQKSILLAVLASIVQYFQLKYSFALKNTPAPTLPAGENEDTMAKTMAIQMEIMKKIMPIGIPLLIFGVAYIKAVIALYLITSTLFALAQELYVQKKILPYMAEHH